MSEFKVGDRVKYVGKDERYLGLVCEIEYFSEDGRFVGVDVGEELPYEFFEENLEIYTEKLTKTQDQLKIEQLEQRIGKLEKCVIGEQNSLEKCENVSKIELTEEKIAPLKRWKEEGYKWIFEDTDGAIHIFKSRPIPYSIEELLKGENKE